MRSGRTIAFVMLTLLVGGVISQMPSALADDSDNPFSAMWDAIFDLQSMDNDLQAQIDELRAERNALLTQTGAEPVFVSDLYAEIEVESTEDGHTLVHVTAGNIGPDRAAGVKLTTFYLMPLFEINSIDGELCEDKSRGIIECVLGTLEADQKSVITIDATARESGAANTWTVDISTTTDDADYTNNHVDYNFETGSGETVEIPEVEQPIEELESEDDVDEEAETDLEQEQDDSGSNSTGTETEELQESGGSQTSTEETPSGNQTSSEPEETVDNSGSNSTSAEGFEDSSDESSSEENADGAAEQEGQDDSSSETGEEQSGSDDGQVEEQEQSGESGTEDSESSDSGESSEQESSDSGSEESSDNGESSEGSSENGSEESPSQ